MLAEISHIQSPGDLTPRRPQKQCDDCHYSCMKCSGPHEFDCTECYTEAARRTNENNQTVCLTPPENVPLEVISTFDGIETHTFTRGQESTGKFIFYVFYVVFIVSITIAITFLIARRLIAQFCEMNATKEQKYVYDRIAYDGSKEQEGVVIGVDSLNSDSELDDNN